MEIIMKKKQVPLLKKGKHKKHDVIVNDFENQKRKHLEKLANKIIDLDQKNQLLKSKNISNKFLDSF
jgi:hypothetical protein